MKDEKQNRYEDSRGFKPSANLHPILFLLSLIGLIFLAGCASEPNFPPGLPCGEIPITAFTDSEYPGARFYFETGQIVYEPDKPVAGDIFFDHKFGPDVCTG